MPNQAALNFRSLGPDRTLEQKFYAAAAAGFAAVGLGQADIDRPDERARQELRLSDLAIAELEGISGWMQSGSTARSLALVQAEHIFATAADIGASLVLAWPSDEPVERLAASTYFADICRAAEPFDVRVGLECTSHPSVVQDLASAWRIVEGAEMGNGGLVIDTFHFHRGGSTIGMIESIPGEKIFLVQLSDAPDLPLNELEDRHRLYPGTGAIPLESILAAVRAKGYNGYYSLELQNEECWKEDPIIVAAEGLRSMRRLDIT